MNMPGEERHETREPVQLYMQFNKALLIVYYLSGTVPGTGDTVKNKHSPCPKSGKGDCHTKKTIARQCYDVATACTVS